MTKKRVSNLIDDARSVAKVREAGSMDLRLGGGTAGSGGRMRNLPPDPYSEVSICPSLCEEHQFPFCCRLLEPRSFPFSKDDSNGDATGRVP